MIRRTIIPVLLFAAVFCVCWFCQRYTLACQEFNGLFLMTPDWLRVTFRSPMPVSTFVSSFLVQFYRFGVYGAAISALLITAAYLLFEATLRRAGIRSELPAALGACILWYFNAKARTPVPATAAVLYSAAVLLVSLAFRKGRTLVDTRWWGVVASVVIIAATAAIVPADKSVRSAERWGKIEYGATTGNWGMVLEAATPGECAKDMLMTPYALLALAQQHQLKEKILDYPVVDSRSFDTEGVANFRGFYFKALLFDSVRCPNESIHNLYQSATYMPHGMTFQTLRSLIARYCNLGDLLLVEKYCAILERSSLHSQYVAHFRELIKDRQQRVPNTPEESAAAGLIDHDLKNTLLKIVKEGLYSDIAPELYFAMRIVDGEIDIPYQNIR